MYHVSLECVKKVAEYYQKMIEWAPKKRNKKEEKTIEYNKEQTKRAKTAKRGAKTKERETHNLR